MFERSILLGGDAEKAAKDTIRRHHYLHSVSSGKSYYFKYGSALAVYSMPVSRHVDTFLLGEPGEVWELSRLWAPDGHERNLLTRALSKTIKHLKLLEPKIDAVVAYSDPYVGHTGHVYKAASWVYHGQSDETRRYIKDGEIIPRRRFHSGSSQMTKAEILEEGYEAFKGPGKHRWVKPISKKAKRRLLK